MNHNCYLDLVLVDRNQISIEMGTSSQTYALTANLGFLLRISEVDGLMHFMFEKGEIRLEITTADLIHFLKPNYQENDET